VSVESEGLQAQDSRGFLLPDLPPSITILQPVEGDEISNAVKIIATISGQSGMVDHVTFLVDDEILGSVERSPYQFDLDLTDVAAGPMEIKVRAEGAMGEILSQHMTTVIIEPPPTATPAPTATIIPVAPVETTEPQRVGMENGVMGIPLWALGIALVLAVGVAYLMLWKRKDRSPRMRRLESETFDSYIVADVLATLEVIKSDNELMIGRKINIEKTITTIGRSATNDIILPDKPVSRHHVELRYDDNVLTVCEIESKDKQGRLRRPTYGTFVNGQKIGLDPVLLKDGDEILFGKRACVRVGLPQVISGDEEHTVDVPIYQSDELHLESTEVDWEEIGDIDNRQQALDEFHEPIDSSTVIEPEANGGQFGGIDIDQTREVDEEDEN
jgi:pSer/pThr/pTyr-binding forkhead associated (FHA) protein